MLLRHVASMLVLCTDWINVVAMIIQFVTETVVAVGYNSGQIDLFGNIVA